VGFDAGSYAVGELKVGYAAPGLTLSVDGSRAPLTDSLMSWAGRWSPDSAAFIGRASWNSVGINAAVHGPSGLFGQTAVRIGQVEALALSPADRDLVAVRAGREADGVSGRYTLAGVATWMRHSRSIEGFSAGDAGVFSPETYLGTFLEFGSRWDQAADLGAGLDLRLGAESVLDPGGSQYFAEGVNPAAGVSGVLTYRLGERAHIELAAYLEVNGFTWERVGVQLGVVGGQPVGRLAPLPSLLGERVVRGAQPFR
jgi:hypothetical protein